MANIAQTTDFRVRKGLAVENTATILSTTGTVSTNSGALQVIGGVGIGGGLYVGGIVTATNMFSGGSQVVTAASLSSYGVSSLTAGTDTVVSTSSGAVTVWNNSTLQTVTNRGASSTNQVTLNNGLILGSTANNPILMNGSYSQSTPAFIVANGTLVGTTTTVNIYAFNYQHNLAPVSTATIANYYGQLFIPTLTNTATYTSMFGAFARIDMSAAATSGTVATWIGFSSENPSRNALADVRFTNHYGFRAADPSAITATNVYGFYSQISAGTNKYNIYASGTAPNYFSGSVGIGGTSFASGQALAVTGGQTVSGIFTSTNTTNATSTTTGALQVVGGVGIGGGLYVGGIVTATTFSSASSLKFTVNGITTSTVLDTAGNVLFGGASAAAGSVTGGSIVQIGDQTTQISSVNNPYAFFNGKYSTAAGIPQYNGNWASSGLWGIGPDTNASDSTIRIGQVSLTSSGYAWSASYANLKVANINATGLTVNGVITATTFYGTFIGTLSTIVSTASTVVTQISNANALYYPTFVSILNTSTNIGQVEYTTSSFTVNPSTGQVNIGTTSTATMNALLGVNGNAYVNGILTATNIFVGPWPVNTSTFSGNAGLANTATTVIVQASNTTANYYPTFVSGNNLNTTTSQSLYTSSSFYINATNGSVTMNNTTVTNGAVILGVTNATSTVTGALQVAGGAGIGRDVQIGGNLYVNNGTQVIPTNIQEFAATGSQTTFTPIGGYAVGTVQVTANGIALGSGDFVASNGSTVVLNVARNTGDIIRIISGGTSSAVNNIKSFSIAMSIAMSM